MPNLLAWGSIIIVGVVAPCNARPFPSDSGSVRLITVSGRPVVDGVYLNGRGPYRFLLDTGAQTNLVEGALARTLGLTPTFRVDMNTAGGSVMVPGGRVADVSLGPASASNQEFLFSSLDEVHALSTKIQGVLGQEFLSRFDYLIDFANHRLVLGGESPTGGDRLDMEFIDGRPAITTSEGKLVLDSGTDVTILYRASSSAMVGQLRTASGYASAATISSLRLRISNREYHPSMGAFLPSHSGRENGLLPASLFRAVFVSNSRGYVVLDPKVN